jgi:anti-sigma B factor antagonist
MMQDRSSTQQIGTIIQPSGQINAETVVLLQQQLVEALSAQACHSLALDMSQVEALDSAGLMLLVSTLTLAQRLDKRFSLFGISPSVRIIFELTQLDRAFNILEGQSQQQPLFAQAAAA